MHLYSIAFITNPNFPFISNLVRIILLPYSNKHRTPNRWLRILENFALFFLVHFILWINLNSWFMDMDEKNDNFYCYEQEIESQERFFCLLLWKHGQRLNILLKKKKMIFSYKRKKKRSKKVTWIKIKVTWTDNTLFVRRLLLCKDVGRITKRPKNVTCYVLLLDDSK